MTGPGEGGDRTGSARMPKPRVTYGWQPRDIIFGADPMAMFAPGYYIPNCFAFWRKVLDRPAFRVPCLHELFLRELTRAIAGHCRRVLRRPGDHARRGPLAHAATAARSLGSLLLKY